MSNHQRPSELVEQFLQDNPSIDLIRLLFTDYGNVTRGRNITVSRLRAIAKDPELRSGLSSVSPYSHIFIPPGGEIHFDIVNVGGDAWIPQWETLRPYGVDPGLGMLVCSLSRNRSEQPLETDPRTILGRNVDEGKEGGLEYRIGFEVEFTIMPSSQRLEGIDEPGGYQSPTAYRSSYWKHVETIVRLAEKVGIPIWSFETESGPGQCEISTSPLDPITAADSLVMLREIIYGVCAKAGLHATLHPMPFDGAGPCGLHTHISVSEPGKNGDHVLAEILEHAPALSALLLGGYDSVTKRLPMLGAGDIGWGQGKHAAVHKLGDEHLELRWPDALTNPYLQLAAIVGVANKGCKEQTRLEMKPMPFVKIGQPIPEDMRADLGLKHSLDLELAGRLQALKADAEAFARIMGKSALDSYIWFREQEISKAGRMNLAARRLKQISNL